MGGFVFIGICILVVSVLRGMQASTKSSELPSNLPPLPTPRRLRKRVTVAPAQNVPPPLASVVTTVAVPVTLAPMVAVALPRYGQQVIRGEFSSRAALRRAIIAQEVLGLPLSLRPPRD